jgi:hypothetical protein
MSLTISANKSDFETTPEGVHIARCIRVIDMGTQKSDWQGKEKFSHKVLFTWELLGDDRMSDGRPFAISKRYTASLNEKSQLYKDLCAWRGRQFTEAERQGFNVANVLGAYCLLQVAHAEKDGNTYANISSIMALPKGSAKPEGVNPLLLLDLSQPETFKVLDGLHEKLVAAIKSSPEWAEANGGEKPSATKELAEMSDDIPF